MRSKRESSHHKNPNRQKPTRLGSLNPNKISQLVLSICLATSAVLIPVSRVWAAPTAGHMPFPLPVCTGPNCGKDQNNNQGCSGPNCSRQSGGSQFSGGGNGFGTCSSGQCGGGGGGGGMGGGSGFGGGGGMGSPFGGGGMGGGGMGGGGLGGGGGGLGGMLGGMLGGINPQQIMSMLLLLMVLNQNQTPTPVPLLTPAVAPPNNNTGAKSPNSTPVATPAQKDNVSPFRF